MSTRQAKTMAGDDAAPAAVKPRDINIARRILMIGNLVKRGGNQTYRTELGLSPIEWSIIARVGDDGPMTQTQLAELTGWDKGQISRAATDMERRGMITRDNATWRSIELRLAPKGSKVLTEIRRIARQRRKSLCAGIAEAELQQFMATLAKIEINATAMLETGK